jgi:hypothetical protein
LQTRQPLPLQNTHSMSASAEGSVNGKYDGRNRIPSGRSKKRSTKVCSMAFKLAKLMFSPTAIPST